MEQNTMHTVGPLHLWIQPRIKNTLLVEFADVKLGDMKGQLYIY